MLKFSQNKVSKKNIKWGSVSFNSNYFNLMVSDIKLYYVVLSFIKLLSSGIISLNLRRTYGHLFLLLVTSFTKKSTRGKFAEKSVHNPLLSSFVGIGKNLSSGSLQVHKYSYYVNLHLYSSFLNKFIWGFFGTKASLALVNYSNSTQYYKKRKVWGLKWLRFNKVFVPSINRLYGSGFLSSRLKSMMLDNSNYRRTVRFFYINLRKEFTNSGGFKLSFKGKLRKLRSNFFTYEFGSVSKGSNSAVYSESSFPVISKVGLSQVTCSTSASVDSSFLLSNYDYSCA